MAKSKTHAPKLDGMIEVNSKNRKQLEKRFGIDIPTDVEFIMPPQMLQEMLDNPETWEEKK